MSSNLVPHLWTAFKLQEVSQINFDPVVVASYCFITRTPLTPQTSLANGNAWFPQRSVKNEKGESTRLKRFAEQFPDVFEYKDDDYLGECISLVDEALDSGDAHECDESIFRIALYRISRPTHMIDANDQAQVCLNQLVCSVIDDLEVGGACIIATPTS